MASPVVGVEADRVRGCQFWLSAVADAMAHPGSWVTSQVLVGVSDGLPCPAAGVLSTLAVVDKPLVLSHELSRSDWIRTWIGNHTGATLVDDPRDVRFAVVAANDVEFALNEFSTSEIEC